MFCMRIHNDSVKALRFPTDDHKNSMETPEERRQREQEEKELVELINSDDDDEDGDDGMNDDI